MSADDARAHAAQGPLAEEVRSWLAANWHGTDDAAWRSVREDGDTSVGTPLDAANVRRSFRRITKAAGLGINWTPRKPRHSFVSIMKCLPSPDEPR